VRSTLVVKSERKRIVYAPVYTPFRVDTDGEAMVPEEIEKMAHRFMLKGRVDCIDVNHDRVKSGCRIVESFVARKGDPDFMEGEWVLGVRILRDDLWESILKGELNGFSFGSENVPTRMAFIVDLLQPVLGAGRTEPGATGQVPVHDHSVLIEFTEQAGIVPTSTGATFGHTHRIARSTATEEAFGHSHRLVLNINC